MHGLVDRPEALLVNTSKNAQETASLARLDAQVFTQQKGLVEGV